jgi:predicted nucleic acid-binding protein
MYLVDTNIWLELILEQDRAKEVREFFESLENHQVLSVTELSIYSVGIILARLGKDEAFLDFISDSIVDTGVIRIILDLEDMDTVISIKKANNLDFDDAYIYAAAEKYDLVIVSFDSDFDRTERGRKAPSEIIKER